MLVYAPILCILFFKANSQYIQIPEEVESRMIKGVPASEGQFPYVVSVRTFEDNYHFCVGTVLAPKWVVSAAVCYLNAKTNKLLVHPQALAVYAETTESSNVKGAHSRVKKLITHPKYKRTPSSIFNNIALLHLKKSLYWKWSTWPFKNGVSPIQFGSVGLGVNLTAVGWGSTDPNKETAVEKVLNFNTFLTTDSQPGGCQSGMDFICALGTDEGGFCYYDAGAPLVDTSGIRPKLVGIASHLFSAKCGAGNPEAFVRIESYLFWVQNVTKVAIQSV